VGRVAGAGAAGGWVPAPLLLRERVGIVAALAGVSAIAWLYLVLLAARMPGMGDGGMADMAGMAMTRGFRPWTLADFALMFVMWWVMMVGMMLPSAAPMILTFARINRSRRAQGEAFVPSSVFAGGYLIAWGGYGLVATLAQWELERVALLSPSLQTTSPILGGALFLLAGLYQFTPLKLACLRHCRSPLGFILNAWRDGTTGALVMGLRHGLECLGCCWFLMALLFVGGVMNLLWVAAIAAFVCVEKMVPRGPWIARLAGVAMGGFGVWLLTQA